MSYDAREKGTYSGSPVELYRFTCGGLSYYFTSADKDQSYGGNTYVREALTRGEIDASDEDTQGALEITTPRTNAVAELFIPGLPVAPVALVLYRFHRGDAEVVQLWSGEIASAAFDGSSVKLTGLPVGRMLRRIVPSNSFQAQCNWALYSAACGISKSSYAKVLTVTAVSGLTVATSTVGTYAGGQSLVAGWMENAAGERHWITGYASNLFTLATVFGALAVGDTVTVYPGCDRTIAACKLFANLQHFNGYPFVPTVNPFTGGLV